MAELYIPDLIGAMERGYKSGQERRRTRTLAQNYMGATQGDQNALAQVYGVDPEAGMQAQTFGLQQRRAQRQEADDDIIRAAKFYQQTKDPRAWAYLHQKFSSDSRFPPMPATIESPEDQEGSLQFANALISSMGGGDAAQAVQSRFINDRGEMVALMRDGSTRVVGKADPSMQIIEGEGGFFGVNRRNLSAAPVQLGGPAVAQPQMPTQGTMESDIEQANQMIQQGRPPEEVDAWLASRGQQVPESMPMGQLRPKQQQISPAEAMRLQMERERIEMQRQEAEERRKANAVTGKPPTEGERKAATLLQRLDFSLNQLQTAVKESPSAASPKVATETLRRLPLIGEVAANAATPAERQRVESAQLDILDAALTLGTGAAYTREQLEGYRKAYFPQIGDTPSAIRDKAARLDNVINAARIAAGRAAAEVQPANRNAQPAARPAQQPASAPRRLKFNPQTGKIE